MTAVRQPGVPDRLASRGRTLVHQFKLRDNVEPNLGKLVLEHLQKHGEQVVDSSAEARVSQTSRKYRPLEREHILLLAEDGGQAADLCAESRPHVLRVIRNQVLDAAHDVVQESRAVHECTEAGDLAGNGSPYLGLVVLEQLDKGGDQVSRDDLVVDGLGNLLGVSIASTRREVASPYLFEPVSNHVPDPPALVLNQVAQRRQQDLVAGLLLLRYHLGD